MTTYTQDSPSPGYEPILYDAQGESWTPSEREGFWRHDESGSEHRWQNLEPDWFPFTTEDSGDRAPSDVTPEIRSQALALAIATGAIIVQQVGDVPDNAKTLYELADQYVRYIATGEHPK